VILGLINGLTYALLGMGLTLIYRTSHVINFAAGSMGALPSLLIPILVINRGWNYWAALGLALGSSLAIGALAQFLVIRPLHAASRLTVLVATIAVSQLLDLAVLYLPKGNGNLLAASYPVPFQATIRIGQLILGAGQLMILIVVPLITIGLTVFLRRSKIGRASRASAENAEAASLAGVPVHRVAFAMWALAGLLSGLSAVLIGPTQPIQFGDSLGPSLMLRALGAAMLGGLLRLPSVFVGGIVIGILESVVLWNYPNGGVLELVIFVLIVVSLLGKRGLGELARGTSGSSWSLAGNLRQLAPGLAGNHRVRSARRAGLVLAAVVAVLLPLPLTSTQQSTLASVVVFAIMGLSLVVLTGFAGQVSLGQFGLVAIGAAVGGRLYQLGLPMPLDLVLATLIGGVIALVIGVPSLWIRGLFLAVTTLGFSVAIAAWLFNQSWIVGGLSLSALTIPRPVVAGVSFEAGNRYYWLCLAALVAVGSLVAWLRRSRLGHSMIACRDNESGAATLGISPRAVKLTAFVISGMIASFAGFLYGGLIVGFSYDPSTTFGAAQSLTLVVMVVLGGVTTITGAILGAAWIQAIPSFLGQSFGILSSGIGLIVILIVARGGLASVVFRIRDWAARRIAERGARAEAAGPITEPAPLPAPLPASPAQPRGAPPAAPAFEASGVTVRYGGVVALDGVSIRAEPGEILGIMGTNGSGKTTLFDVVSGRLRPNAGTVTYAGVDVTRWSTHRRARAGFGRTFQQARLFDGLSLVEIVTLASESSDGEAGDVGDVMERLGLGPYRHRYAGELSTGVRRLGELACVVASGSRLLLLDEPTAGFAVAEVDEFCSALIELRDQLNATVIVIDHDVPMMGRLVERLYVLEAGRIIAEGRPEILRENPAVVAAYLGRSKEGTEGSPRK
jgi:ABC-type branched-subunit amino acid transport system ATPase component/ABC-type branched-subunit amino acid transport system permease subunit